MAIKHDWPSDAELEGVVKDAGSITAAAWKLEVPRKSLSDRLRKQGIASTDQETTVTRADAMACGLSVEGNTAVLIEPPTTRPKLGDVGELIKERGLDPEEWVVVSTTLNEWDGPVSGGGTQRLKQWKVTLRRAPHIILALPAQHIPTVRRSRVGPAASEQPETIVVEGDHQIPYHDPRLHEAACELLSYLHRKHRLAEQVFLGDTGDFPSISRFPDHPAAMAGVNEVLQGCYDRIRDKRDAAPNIRVRKLKGNHDWRLEGELLARAERMYGIKPADTPEDGPELPALHLRRLLHLDKLGVELVEDPRGWQHGEVELIAGARGLVVRHGWITGANTAAKSLAKRGRSIIVGHSHTRETHYKWDPSAEVERQALVAGTMSLCRDERFPHFTVADSWLPGLVVVTRWPDGRFAAEHAIWNGQNLTWRDQTFTA